MKRFLAALLGLCAGAALATTVNIPLTVTVTPTQTTITVAGQTTVIPVATTPPVQPPSSNNFWVYQNGTFGWAGDYNFGLAAFYKDTSGAPATGMFDLKATLTSAWGGWLPYAGCPSSTPNCGIPLWNMNVAGYTKLTFDAKATVAGQKWNVYFVKVGDVPLPSNCSAAVPQAKVGDWETHVIMLSAMCIGPGLSGGTQIYKFAIQDQTGLAVNSWYLNNVGFVP